MPHQHKPEQVTKLIKPRRGVSLSGYGLVVGLISVVALAAVTGSGSSVNELFLDVSNTLGSVIEPGSGASAAPSETPSGVCTSSGSQSFTSPGTFTFDVTSDIAGCTYSITITGAGGGGDGGGTGGVGGGTQFDFIPGSSGTMDILVGDGGNGGTDTACGCEGGDPGGGGNAITNDGGGGGASALVFDGTLVSIAGGGGGATNDGSNPGGAGGGGNSSGVGATGGGGAGGGGGIGGANSGDGGAGGDAGLDGANATCAPSAANACEGGSGSAMFSIGGGGGGQGGAGGGGYGGGAGGDGVRAGGGGGGFVDTGLIVGGAFTVITGGVGGGPSGTGTDGGDGSITFSYGP